MANHKSYHARKNKCVAQLGGDKKMGAIKQGRGTCSTFKVINLIYLHILRAGIVYITLWYVHVPRSVLEVCART